MRSTEPLEDLIGTIVIRLKLPGSEIQNLYSTYHLARLADVVGAAGDFVQCVPGNGAHAVILARACMDGSVPERRVRLVGEFEQRRIAALMKTCRIPSQYLVYQGGPYRKILDNLPRIPVGLLRCDAEDYDATRAYLEAFHTRLTAGGFMVLNTGTVEAEQAVMDHFRSSEPGWGWPNVEQLIVKRGINRRS